jgi:hypothetical protein
MLAVFLFAQAMPMLALGVTDVPVGMECCRTGKAKACCKRKAMHDKPALQAPSHCKLPCCGQPSNAAPLLTTAASPMMPTAELLAVFAPIAVTANEARTAAGVDPSLYQRPPPSRFVS